MPDIGRKDGISNERKIPDYLFHDTPGFRFGTNRKLPVNYPKTKAPTISCKCLIFN